MEQEKVIAALVEVINAPTRPPALRSLAYIRYPARELCLQVNPGGSISAALAVRGWEYKHKGPRPKTLPHIDTVAVQAALNAVLPDGLSVTAVQDHGQKLQITIKENKSWS